MRAGGRALSWWEAHDNARRDAIALLITASAICAAYVATVIAIIVVALRLGEAGPWRGIETWQHRIGPLGVAGLGAAFLALGAFIIAALARLGFARHVLRRAGARPPRSGEAGAAQAVIADVALGVGLVQPRLAIVDDPAVNAFAAGRRSEPAIVLTAGALELPPDELEALCAHTVICGSMQAEALAAAAAGVIVDADWLTRIIWGVAGFVFLASVVGVPAEAVAITVLMIAVLVVVTKPLVLLASRAIVELLDRAAELADLETVRITNRPEALARLMLDTVEHRVPVHSTWDIAHLWFDPETTTSPSEHWWSLFPTVRPIAGPDSRRTRGALIKRTQALLDVGDCDEQLRRRLARISGRAGA